MLIGVELTEARAKAVLEIRGVGLVRHQVALARLGVGSLPDRGGDGLTP
jgi:hypothetical protein